SSYYNAPVSINICQCEEVIPGTYNRVVELQISGHKFCTAHSIIALHSDACIEAVRGKSIGIGQLFRSCELAWHFSSRCS
ncbi:unnamed protein product, partial [Chrysoparadoxa australica]